MITRNGREAAVLLSAADLARRGTYRILYRIATTRAMVVVLRIDTAERSTGPDNRVAIRRTSFPTSQQHSYPRLGAPALRGGCRTNP